jgi:hypothetical protein
MPKNNSTRVIQADSLEELAEHIEAFKAESSVATGEIAACFSPPSKLTGEPFKTLVTVWHAH